MIVDHLIQYRISSWPKTTEESDFGTCVTDGHTDGPTDGRTDRPTDIPSYRDAFLTDASKKEVVKQFDRGIVIDDEVF